MLHWMVVAEGKKKIKKSVSISVEGGWCSFLWAFFFGRGWGFGWLVCFSELIAQENFDNSNNLVLLSSSKFGRSQ